MTLTDHEHCAGIGKCWQDRFPCPALVPDIRACLVCGRGVLCDEDYPAHYLVVCWHCIHEDTGDDDHS